MQQVNLRLISESPDQYVQELSAVALDLHQQMELLSLLEDEELIKLNDLIISILSQDQSTHHISS